MLSIFFPPPLLLFYGLVGNARTSQTSTKHQNQQKWAPCGSSASLSQPPITTGGQCRNFPSSCRRDSTGVLTTMKTGKTVVTHKQYVTSEQSPDESPLLNAHSECTYECDGCGQIFTSEVTLNWHQDVTAHTRCHQSSSHTQLLQKEVKGTCISFLEPESSSKKIRNEMEVLHMNKKPQSSRSAVSFSPLIGMEVSILTRTWSPERASPHAERQSSPPTPIRSIPTYSSQIFIHKPSPVRSTAPRSLLKAPIHSDRGRSSPEFFSSTASSCKRHNFSSRSDISTQTRKPDLYHVAIALVAADILFANISENATIDYPFLHSVCTHVCTSWKRCVFSNLGLLRRLYLPLRVCHSSKLQEQQLQHVSLFFYSFLMPSG